MMKACPTCKRRHICGVKKRKPGRRARATAEIREAVLKRSRGWCEACGQGPMTLELDHWLGGSGRRVQKQSVETCWALCRECHYGRTHNIPGAVVWNAHFRHHCERYGYPVIEHVVHQELPR